MFPGRLPLQVLSVGKYDGKKADVWGCGVVLYVLLAGASICGALP